MSWPTDRRPETALPPETGPLGEIFRLEGEYWTICHEGNVLRLRDTKGLQYVAHLLRHPHQKFRPFDLVLQAFASKECSAPESGEAQCESVTLERARSAVTKRIHASLAKIHSHDPVLGRYLLTTIKTGHVCVYVPDTRNQPGWRT